MPSPPRYLSEYQRIGLVPPARKGRSKSDNTRAGYERTATWHVKGLRVERFDDDALEGVRPTQLHVTQHVGPATYDLDTYGGAAKSRLHDVGAVGARPCRSFRAGEHEGTRQGWQARGQGHGTQAELVHTQGRSGAAGPVYGTPARSSAAWRVPSSPGPPWQHLTSASNSNWCSLPPPSTSALAQRTRRQAEPPT